MSKSLAAVPRRALRRPRDVPDCCCETEPYDSRRVARSRKNRSLAAIHAHRSTRTEHVNRVSPGPVSYRRARNRNYSSKGSSVCNATRLSMCVIGNFGAKMKPRRTWKIFQKDAEEQLRHRWTAGPRDSSVLRHRFRRIRGKTNTPRTVHGPQRSSPARECEESSGRLAADDDRDDVARVGLLSFSSPFPRSPAELCCLGSGPWDSRPARISWYIEFQRN